MPTGYTAGVQDGTITTFADFAMVCARAFGATIDMRDLPMTAEIPDEFVPAPYYAERLAKDEAELARIQQMDEAEWQAGYSSAVQSYAADRAESRARTAAQKARYEAMKSIAEAWTPPTADHIEFKAFMVSQLAESIKFDCSGYDYYADDFRSFGQWKPDCIKMAHEAVARSLKNLNEEKQRCVSCSKWVRDLRASLKQGLSL